MDTRITLLAAFALGACNPTAENTDGDSGLGEFATGLTTESIKQRLANGDLTVCADRQVSDFIIAKAKEDIGLPPFTMKVERQSGWYMGYAFHDGVRFQQSHWEAAVDQLDVSVGDVTAEGYDEAIDELACEAVLQIGDETQSFNFVIRPGLSEDVDFVLGGSVTDQPQQIDFAVKRQAFKIMEAALPKASAVQPVAQPNETLAGQQTTPESQAAADE